jgi:hypothetical protein
MNEANRDRNDLEHLMDNYKKRWKIKEVLCIFRKTTQKLAITELKTMNKDGEDINTKQNVISP